jgi:hypothetical protein
MPSGYPVLTPTYGLGSYGRVVGSSIISSPRTRYGSAGRIYSYLARTQNVYVAQQFIRNAAFGPFVIQRGRLVWN